MRPAWSPRIRSALTRRAWTWSWWLSLLLHTCVVSAFVAYWLYEIKPAKLVMSEPLEIDGGFRQRTEDSADASMDPLRIEPMSERFDRSKILKDIQVRTEQAQERGDQENFSQLNQLSADLRRNSTPKTVDEMSEFFGGIFGKRAKEPDPTGASGPFDVSTAQMHDITKQTDEQNNVRYVIVMIDAQGVTQTIDIDAENGERLYKTMKLIKSNPLLERVYRNIIMGILDQVLKDQADPPSSL